MIKHILFDLDGTLLDFNKGEAKSFIKTMKDIASYNPTKDDVILFSKINEECFLKYSNKELLRSEFHHLRFKRIFEELNIKADIDIANSYYVNELKYSAELFDDVIECLYGLYDLNNYNLYIASNGMTEVQMKRLNLAKIDKYFIKNYISENIGFNKPDKEFFKYIFNDLNDFDTSHYLIIGDRLDSDILGGNNVGIKTIFINRNNIDINDIKPDYEIINLKEILNILKEID